MARQETILSVFVASPSDVDEERDRLEDVVRELNTAWARHLGIRLELIRWETDAYPSFGDDPQAVINEQMPQDFDLFIGIMWYRFGTPTGRAGSGTVEEFQRAKDRYDANPDALQLMIYFKDSPAPVPPSQLDAKQLASISEFRSSLGNEGGLYWSFQTTDEFEKLVRLHLTRHIQAWQSKASIARPSSASIEEMTTTKDASDQDGDDEIGLLDLMEQFEDEFSTLEEITERIASATVEIGEKMNARAAETTEFAAGPDAQNRKAAKRLVAKAAADMDQYVHRMELELPLFSQHLNAGLNALTRAAALSIEFNIEKEDLEQAKDTVSSIREFRDTMSTVEGQIAIFRETVAALPRMTTVLNRSKRAMVNVIQRLIDEFRGAQVMAREAETSFASIVNDNVPVDTGPMVDNELNTEQINILKKLAEFEGNEVTAEIVAYSIGENVTRVKHYLSQLVDREYVYNILIMGEGLKYAIANRGREYLVVHDLI